MLGAVEGHPELSGLLGTLKEARRASTPAMAAGLTDRVWTVEDLLGLMAAVPNAA
jgi:hypothetical protein